MNEWNAVYLLMNKNTSGAKNNCVISSYLREKERVCLVWTAIFNSSLSLSQMKKKSHPIFRSSSYKQTNKQTNNNKTTSSLSSSSTTKNIHKLSRKKGHQETSAVSTRSKR
mmetsp:Transcript_51631/g.57667  ORF Transcript_51631/g.57667 Transcript_51631/m.57667 type:complete len:111 (+) Transcript_51631:392-724(+)